jgi:hypothetical protein
VYIPLIFANLNDKRVKKALFEISATMRDRKKQKYAHKPPFNAEFESVIKMYAYTIIPNALGLFQPPSTEREVQTPKIGKTSLSSLET